MVRRLISALKGHLLLLCIAIITIMIAVAWLLYKTKDDSLSIGISDDIDSTPTLVEQVREIGQWEFLSISDEELIDTVRTGFFSDDELVRIYYGTLRLGIDFSQCTEEWVIQEGDSVRLDLPPVTLLDENFLDEAATKSFFEAGKWTNADRKQMAERAKAAMRHRCLTKQNLDHAQKNAEEQVRRFLNAVRKKVH